jgi:predicted ArsR family transcriptional regulator
LINFFRSRHSIQQNILELLHKEGPIETDNLSKRLQVKKADMERELASLRHIEK